MKVVLGVDGSPASIKAVEWAARSSDAIASVLVICAVHPGLAMPDSEMVRIERDAGGGLLEFGQRPLQDFEKSPRPMRIFERETCQYLAVKDAAVALYGYSREEFLTLTVKDTRHPDEHHELLESFV